jgi:hypothetical protein
VHTSWFQELLVFTFSTMQTNLCQHKLEHDTYLQGCQSDYMCQKQDPWPRANLYIKQSASFFLQDRSTHTWGSSHNWFICWSLGCPSHASFSLLRGKTEWVPWTNSKWKLCSNSLQGLGIMILDELGRQKADYFRGVWGAEPPQWKENIAYWTLRFQDPNGIPNERCSGP